GSDIKFQIGVASNHFTDPPGGRLGQWRTAKIGMQNHSRGINDGLERELHGAVQMPRNCLWHVGDSKLNCILRSKRSSIDLIAKTRDYRANRIRHRRLAFTSQQRGQIRALEQLIYRWKQAKEIGLGGGGHWLFLYPEPAKRVREPCWNQDS